jgi:ABC-type transport system involved in multi-copper enzyme maturation permease subunit
MHSIIIDLFGPIFAKELVEMARRWRYYMNRIILGGVVLFVLFVAYENNRQRYNPTTATMVPIGMSKMAEVFFQSYLWVQFLSVFLFVPFFLTGVISGEREQKTLDLLFTTQLRDRDIIFGKLGSRVVSMLMLILSGIPIIAITMLMGGVNPQTLWQGMIATMNALLFTSAIAIYMSATTRTTIGALVRTYWWLIVTILLIPLGIMLASEVCVYIKMYFNMQLVTSDYTWRIRREYQQIASTTLSILNPVTQFAVAVDPSLGTHFSAILGPWHFFIFMIVPTLFSCLLIFLAIRAVRREPTDSKWAARFRWLFMGILRIMLMKRLTKRIISLIPPAQAETIWGMPVTNPLWLRSRMAYVYDREKHIQRFQIAGWFLFFFIFFMMVFWEPRFIIDRDSAIIFVSWVWLGTGIFACLVSGYSIAGDRRKGFFEFVLVTPLQPFEAILGTFLATWRHIKWSYILAILATCIFMLFGKLTLFNGLVSILIGSLYISLLILHGILFSLMSRSVATGLLAAFAFPLLIVMVIPMMGSMFRTDTVNYLRTLALIVVPVGTLLLLLYKNLFTVVMFMVSLHLGLTVLATTWIFQNMDFKGERPLLVINGGVQTLMPLESSPYSPSQQQGELWTTGQVMYTLAVVVNIAFLLWWICRNYDQLTGRKEWHRWWNRQTIPVSH